MKPFQGVAICVSGSSGMDRTTGEVPLVDREVRTMAGFGVERADFEPGTKVLREAGR